MSRSLSEAEVLPSSPEDTDESFHTGQLQDYYRNRCAITSTIALGTCAQKKKIISKFLDEYIHGLMFTQEKRCGRDLIFQQTKAQTES